MNDVAIIPRTVAVIGAGMAGLSCAATLAAAGCRVTVFDKGRRPGGRIATRRAAGAMFNHGAQFATARGAAFAALLQRLGAVPWPAAAKGEDVAWVGAPGMSALPGAMAEALAAQGVEIITERHVSWLHQGGMVRHWSAAEAKPGSTHDTGGEVSGPFDTVLLALPSVQAIPLLATRGHGFAQTIAGVSIAPCWAVMASFAERIDSPDVLRSKERPLAWIARDSGRPGRMQLPDSWMLHASAAWSRAHLEEDAETVIAALMADFRNTVGSAAAALHVSAHRWRYALVDGALGEACLWDPSARLGLCGDWCLGPRVEAAHDSGVALARLALL